MISRIRKSMQEKDKGFTLIELLVVMIIIGILAAIAIPVFLNQRKKAVDTAATSDISTIGKEISTYYVDATAVLKDTDLTLVDGGKTTAHYELLTQSIGKASAGMTGVTLKPTATDLTEQKWCVELAYTGGTKSVVSYSAQGGLAKGTACS